MLKNYLKIALRNIQRNKAYSFINIVGLSLGVSCCLLLTLYIQDEFSYDKHHNNLNNLYRVTTHFESENGLNDLAATSPPVATALWNEIPEIESAARAFIPPGVSQNLIQYEDNIFYEIDGYIADSTIFDIISYDFIAGTSKTALTEPNTVVITDRLATKLFGKEPALDKIISISQGDAPGGVTSINFKITGVIKEELKSHLHVNFFTSMYSEGWAAYLRSDRANGEWAGQNFVPAYLKLTSSHNVEEVVTKMNQVLDKYGSEDLKAMGMKKTLGLEPIKNIYLKSSIGKSPRMIYTYVIVAIAVFILLIACINFMNLSTAKAAKRAGEIGIRKAMGAFRSSLISQILGEAMIIVLFSMILSIVIMLIALPYFNELTSKSLSFGSENAGYNIVMLFVITVVTGLIAGSYPAFYLSSFQPAQVLKGKFSMSRAAGWLRRSLVIFQFMVAITLVCGMMIISRQLTFMQEKDLGFDANAKVILPLQSNTAKTNYGILKRELLRNNGVQQVSGADYLPGSIILSDKLFYRDGSTMEKAILNHRNMVDHGYLELLDIKLIAGRKFSPGYIAGKDNLLIVNRTSAKEFGYEPETIIGQHVYSDWQGQKQDYQVIGVMEDYHQLSLKEEIKPVMFQKISSDQVVSYIILSIDKENFQSTIASIEKVWTEMVNDTPFEYSFLDENIQKQYDEDNNIANIITSFTFIAMFISCLGLYGLSTYMAEKRFKEIGVRKVLGASVGQIVGLMSKEFGKLVLIAFLIAVPISWYAMNIWLEGFAYRVSIDVFVFIFAGLGALLIALLTVSFESLKAASTNPVNSLRNE